MLWPNHGPRASGTVPAATEWQSVWAQAAQALGLPKGRLGLAVGLALRSRSWGLRRLAPMPPCPTSVPLIAYPNCLLSLLLSFTPLSQDCAFFEHNYGNEGVCLILTEKTPDSNINCIIFLLSILSNPYVPR